ncbi:MAG: RluA family pseudouridine synthase [Gammaproteobacteria bacterium]|nr:RluA family pseudouridine synthase [Gammaproteobacteria bacterium]
MQMNKVQTNHTTEADGGRRVRYLKVGDAGDGQRLDNFLLARYKHIPKSRLYRTIRSGEVRVNSRRAKPHQRLGAGDRVRVPPLEAAPVRATSVGDGDIAALERRILHEDGELIVINKPANRAAHAGTGHNYGVVDVLRRMRPDDDVQLAHRLDKSTSGCLAAAKSRAALLRLHNAFRAGDVDKRYNALVIGRWDAPGEVSQALARGPQRLHADDDGKAATSRFKVLRRCKGHTLVEVRLLTGRTHQIRVHAAHCGHPVAGDRKYGNFTANRTLAKMGLKRMFLHARRLAFEWNGKTLACEAPLPDELEALLKQL